AAQRAHVRRRLAEADRGDDRLQVGPGGEQLVGEAGLTGTGTHERLRERDQRQVLRLRRRRAPALRRRLVRAPTRAGDRIEQLARAAALRARADAADARQVLLGGGPAPCHLDEAGVAQHALNRAVLALGGLLAPLHELARDRAGGGVQAAHARQPLED